MPFVNGVNSLQMGDFMKMIEALYIDLNIEDQAQFADEAISEEKERIVQTVEGWNLDDNMQAIFDNKLNACKTKGDISNLRNWLFHIEPPPSIFRNVARINKEGKRYWFNAFIDYCQKNKTF